MKCPTKADAGDAYYFVRRRDKLDVVIMGFSMGKGWLNGVSYEASEMRNHLFLGPITPKLFDAAQAALSYLEDTGESCGTSELIAQLRTALNGAQG
jgi:hypothetical protein